MRAIPSFASVLLAAASIAQEPAPAPKPVPTPKPAEPAAEGKPMTWTGVLNEKEFAALHDLKQQKPPAPRGQTIDLAGGKAYLSLPEQGEPPFPGIVVIHEWWGLNDHIRHWADRLAADGYAALAVDLYGGEVATSSDAALAAMKKVDEAKARATLLTAHKFLAADSRVRAQRRGCIGWCFGGGWSLQLALSAPDLDAAVLYYGRLVDAPDQLAAIQAPVLGVFGNRDASIPPKAVDAFAQAMEKAGKDCRILRYDADHAFANPSGAHYDAENAGKAWAEVREFLDAHLRRPAKAPADKPGKSEKPGTSEKPGKSDKAQPGK